MRNHSSDHTSPLISLGEVHYSSPSNLPGIDKLNFQVDSYLAYSESSRLKISWNGVSLLEESGWNDYYGFGTSPDSLLDDWSKILEKLIGGPEMSIITTIESKLCIASKDAPFYNHAQRIETVPYLWTLVNKIEISEPTEFVVWKNGKITEDAKIFLDEVKRLVSLDSAPARNGNVHSVFSRKKPVSEFGVICQMLKI
jgi:hypothetical protein